MTDEESFFFIVNTSSTLSRATRPRCSLTRSPFPHWGRLFNFTAYFARLRKEAFCLYSSVSPVERHYQNWDKDKLDDDAGDGIYKRARNKRAEGKGAAAKSHTYKHCDTPNDPARKHCGDKRKIYERSFPRQVLMHQGRNNCVCGKLERHTDGGGEEGRHTKHKGAKQGCGNADGNAPLPAAEEAAKNYGDM